jgi:hypothetical protein
MKIYINANKSQITHQNGIFGDQFEIAVKEYLGLEGKKSPKNKRDCYYNNHYIEIKQGAFEFNTEYSPEGLKSAFKGSGYVAFIPKMEQDPDGMAWFNPSNVKIYKKVDFINAIIKYYYAVDKGIIKKTRDKAHLQGLWNASKNAPHGKKIYSFMPYIESYALGSLQDLKNGTV